MAVVNEAAVMQEDAYSARIATATMTAVVPAWVKAGRSTSELWRAVVSSLGAVPASRRLALLSTLKEVLPEVSNAPLCRTALSCARCSVATGAVRIEHIIVLS
jgi:hypothetical protein